MISRLITIVTSFLKTNDPLFVKGFSLELPGMLSGAVLSFIASINELSSTIILYSGRMGTISVAIYTEIFKDGYGMAAALATILTVSTIIALIIFDKVSGGKSVVG